MKKIVTSPRLSLTTLCVVHSDTEYTPPFLFGES